MTKRKDALTQVEEYKKLIQPYIGNVMIVSFDQFTLPMIITDVFLAKLGDLANKPNNRRDAETGKNYKPPVMQIKTEQGNLFFYLEDIQQIAAITRGIQIRTAANIITIRQE